MTDQTAELRALADQLRATIAELDERIEARARQLADEYRPDSTSTAVREALEKIEVVGEMMRQEMLARVPGDEGRAFVESMPSVTWTASAARFLVQVADREYQEHKRERGDG